MSESPGNFSVTEFLNVDGSESVDVSFATSIHDGSQSSTQTSSISEAKARIIALFKDPREPRAGRPTVEDYSDLFGVRGYGPPKKSRGRPAKIRRRYNVILEAIGISDDEDSVLCPGITKTRRSGRPVKSYDSEEKVSEEAPRKSVIKRRIKRHKKVKRESNVTREDTQSPGENSYSGNKREGKFKKENQSEEPSSDDETPVVSDDDDADFDDDPEQLTSWTPYNRVTDPEKIKKMIRSQKKQRLEREEKEREKEREKVHRQMERFRKKDKEEFNFSSDSDTQPGFMFIDLKGAKIMRPRKKAVQEKNEKIIQLDPFASPKKQRVGVLQLQDLNKSPSKRGLLPNTMLSPARTPNGHSGSPRKVRVKTEVEERQDRSARKKLNKKLYALMDDDDAVDRLDDETFQDDVRLAEKIIRESREEPLPQTPSKSQYTTPRKGKRDLPTHNPDFVATPLPTAREDEDFLEFKFDDKALFLDGPDGYFDQHRTKIRTSHNSMVQAPALDYDEFNSLVLLSGFLHHPQKEKLQRNYRELYTQWMFELQEGFNLLFFGVGSKRAFLLSFLKDCVMENVDAPALVVNGYNPLTNFSEILKQIATTMKIKGAPKRTGELVEFLTSKFEKMKDKSVKLVLLFHNIDAEPLRDEKVQDYMSKIASIKQFYVISSVDHINAPLLWDSIRLSDFNFVWHNITTFTDYLTETSFRDPLVLGQTQKSAGSKGAKYVLSSLTNNSKSLYRVLASNQLQNMEDELAGKDAQRDAMRGSLKTAVEFQRLFHLCAEEFISSNEINFRTMLHEFVEHKMAVLAKDQSGTEMVFIPFSLEELQKLLEEELL